MGSDDNFCWEFCFGKEEMVAAQLTTIVKEQGFDGVVIDYEYEKKYSMINKIELDGMSHVGDGNNGKKFLKDVTPFKSPRKKLKIPHCPMVAPRNLNSLKTLEIFNIKLGILKFFLFLKY